jgi:fructose-bisphosphate aldolase class I
MNATNLETTARSLVASGKGILAADESTPTIAKRFEAVGLTSRSSPRLPGNVVHDAGLGGFHQRGNSV